VAHTDLEELIINLGTRLRGQTGGRQRLGKLVVMSNADYDPALWERFDLAEALPEYYWSIMLTTYDNPYLTHGQVEAFERRIKDPARRRQFMMSERPLPRGKEFTPELLKKAQCQSLDDLMDHALENRLAGYAMETMEKAGTVLWVTPPNEHDQYILVGDPGQSMPPNRNSAVIMAIKVTGFPDVPAELAAFWWGPIHPDQVGSYWPFIYQMEEWYRMYQPVYAGFDATGVQKGFDELVFAQRNMLMEGIQMQNQKMRMVIALKLIMGKGKLLLPKRIQSIWLQLAGWHMPDTKLRQDVASCLFMVADVLNRLFVIEPEVIEQEPTEAKLAEGERVYRNMEISHVLRRARRQRPHRWG